MFIDALKKALQYLVDILGGLARHNNKQQISERRHSATERMGLILLLRTPTAFQRVRFRILHRFHRSSSDPFQQLPTTTTFCSLHNLLLFYDSDIK